MMKKFDRTRVFCMIIVICTLVFAVLEFMLHRKVIFMKDDLWYITNIATGGPLKGISDVLESQTWHFMNWGGRCITHALLQFILMGGELFADIMNLVAACTLSYLICQIAGKVTWVYFCAAFISLISLNPDAMLSIFWQSGSVNYLYSSNWILLFLLLYIRQVKCPEASSLKGAFLWVIPLGLITGWSNENMGPASFAFSIIVIAYFVKFLHKKVPLWMYLGSASSLIGSILVIVAPGNFVRNAFMSDMTFFETLYDRFLSMLGAGTNFLFPTFLFLLIFLLLYLKAGNQLQPFQILLMITAVLAYGAMILSPTFPRRACFGIMVVCITLILSFLQGIHKKYAFLYTLWMWAFGMYVLLIEYTA